MANLKSAKKAAIQSEKRHANNVARKSSIKTAFKKVIAALEEGKTRDEVQVLFNDAQAQCARAKGKSTLHAKTASRKVSRLALRVQTHFATAAAK
ncbi:MAG TPA: 30S ribosomal protein S20 [Candidatus Saccharimonadales bacterium]|nr:30S ribosomal protein S20 [Candidatus Saccharimonadales bacterium]